MKQFNGLNGAEAYAANSSKKHNADRYVTKSVLINEGVRYFVYEKKSDIDDGEKLLSHFKNGERQ